MEKLPLESTAKLRNFAASKGKTSFPKVNIEDKVTYRLAVPVFKRDILIIYPDTELLPQFQSPFP